MSECVTTSTDISITLTAPQFSIWPTSSEKYTYIQYRTQHTVHSTEYTVQRSAEWSKMEKQHVTKYTETQTQKHTHSTAINFLFIKLGIPGTWVLPFLQWQASWLSVAVITMCLVVTQFWTLHQAVWLWSLRTVSPGDTLWSQPHCLVECSELCHLEILHHIHRYIVSALDVKNYITFFLLDIEICGTFDILYPAIVPRRVRQPIISNVTWLKLDQ